MSAGEEVILHSNEVFAIEVRGFDHIGGLPGADRRVSGSSQFVDTTASAATALRRWSAVICPYQHQVLRPLRLASYSATSAALYSTSVVLPWFGQCAEPMLALTCMGAPLNVMGSDRLVMMRQQMISTADSSHVDRKSVV